MYHQFNHRGRWGYQPRRPVPQGYERYAHDGYGLPPAPLPPQPWEMALEAKRAAPAPSATWVFMPPDSRGISYAKSIWSRGGVALIGWEKVTTAARLIRGRLSNGNTFNVIVATLNRAPGLGEMMEKSPALYQKLEMLMNGGGTAEGLVITYPPVHLVVIADWLPDPARTSLLKVEVHGVDQSNNLVPHH